MRFDRRETSVTVVRSCRNCNQYISGKPYTTSVRLSSAQVAQPRNGPYKVAPRDGERDQFFLVRSVRIIWS